MSCRESSGAPDGSSMPPHGLVRCDGHHIMVDARTQPLGLGLASSCVIKIIKTHPAPAENTAKKQRGRPFETGMSRNPSGRVARGGIGSAPCATLDDGHPGAGNPE